MNLALFDLDNTLLAGDSDFEWAQYLISRGVLDREVYEARNIDFYEQYKAGTLDIHEFLDFQLKPLSRHPRQQLDAWHADFMATRILPIVTVKGRELVRRHLAEGALAAIVTATNSFVTAPIAREFGIAHLVATEPEQTGGEFTGGAHPNHGTTTMLWDRDKNERADFKTLFKDTAPGSAPSASTTTSITPVRTSRATAVCLNQRPIRPLPRCRCSA